MPGRDPQPEPLRRNRDFTLFWCGQLVSTLGSRISSVAYPLLVLGLTGSPADVGAVAAAQTLPYLLWFLPAGALVDRWDRKRVMLVADAGRLAALATLVVALAADRLRLPHVAAVAFVEGTLFVFFELAENAALPRIVSQHQMAAALAQNQARMQGADLLGQPLGGVMFGLGRAVPFVADLVSYGVSFVTLLFVRPPFQEARDHGGGAARLAGEVREGIAWVVGRPFLRTVVLLVAGSNFASNALFLVVIIRAESLGASPALIGLMLGFFGAGALVGSAVAARVARRFSVRAAVVGSLWLWAVVTAALVPVRSPLLLGALFAVQAVGGPIFNVAFAAYRYRIVPDRLQGRVTSAMKTVAWGTIPLGGLAAGLLVEWVGAAAAIGVLAGELLVVAVAGSVAPSMRRADPVVAPADATV